MMLNHLRVIVMHHKVVVEVMDMEQLSYKPKLVQGSIILMI